ncbi:MAG: hypothetical protein ACKOXJ_02330, partial [Alphaproteobacteria bacterium]
NIRENIELLESKFNEINKFLIIKKIDYVATTEADPAKIKKCKNELMDFYHKGGNIKTIFQRKFIDNIKPKKFLIFNSLYDKDPFVKDSMISTDIGRVVGQSMMK